MKKLSIILLLPALCWLYSCNNSSNNKGLSTDIVGKTPTMVFTDTTHDFGLVYQGDHVHCTFKFKNTGTVDLVISSATGSCGCTVPSYPKKSVPPGQEGQIDVNFDSSGKLGKVEKMVSLVTNCQPNTRILTITADIQINKNQQQ
ncbi:MAG TPA: DUF1573 domain-containing protein [Bacteroidia bacterium]|jgi:hypothetical protein|nr:DUF1573 domain-containing protein [Bacteroidia bacterium]